MAAKTKKSASKSKPAATENMAPQGNPGGLALLKKLSAKNIMGDVSAYVPDEVGETVELFRIFGKVSTLKRGESTYGPWIKFGGTFGAIRTHDGAQFRSGAMLLPAPVDAILAGAVEQSIADAKDNDGEVVPVEFKAVVSIRATVRKNPTDRGYEYICQTVGDPAAKDELAHLSDSVKVIGHDKG